MSKDDTLGSFHLMIAEAMEEKLQEKLGGVVTISATWDWYGLTCGCRIVLRRGSETLAIARGTARVDENMTQERSWIRAFEGLLQDMARFVWVEKHHCGICDEERYEILLQRDGICDECWRDHARDVGAVGEKPCTCCEPPVGCHHDDADPDAARPQWENDDSGIERWR